MGNKAWAWKGNFSVPSLPVAQRTRLGRLLSTWLLVLGGLFLLAALAYAGYAGLNTWLMAQDRYLVSSSVVPISVPTMTSTPSATTTAMPLPTNTALPTPTRSPTATPTPVPLSPPVQIQIPALGLKRSIIPLPRTRDRRTGTWTWDTDRLFRPGRSDLVGHWQGSAYPGQTGNMILVGHNYGYGYNGVFVNLPLLKAGQKIRIVNQAGQTFTYQVTTVRRLKWRKQSWGELTLHLSFLSPGGPERLTLVSCAGADVEPFPERVYVVAEPVGK